MSPHEIGKDHGATFCNADAGPLTREWPYKLDQILTGAEDLSLPRTLHPIFHGSFDCHSCVHGGWQVMRIARLFPGMSESIAAERMFLPHSVQDELTFLARSITGGPLASINTPTTLKHAPWH